MLPLILRFTLANEYVISPFWEGGDDFTKSKE